MISVIFSLIGVHCLDGFLAKICNFRCFQNLEHFSNPYRECRIHYAKRAGKEPRNYANDV